MGLVSELKEQVRCKVMLIFNEDEFSDANRAVYARYTEKVVDQKLQFVMSSDDAVELGLSADMPLREFVAEPIHHLDINNIRVIQKIESALRMIYPLVKIINSTVKLVRELGFENKADEIIEIYIDQRKDTPQLFDVEHQSRLGEVDDQKARARFLDVFNASGNALGLRDAARFIVQNEHWNDGIVPALLHAPPDQLIDLLRESQRPDL